MIPLVQLKQNLEFNHSLQEIIDVFRIAAAVQLRQLQARHDLYDPFPKQVIDGLRLLDIEGARHPFLIHRRHLPSCIVVITSDEGFSGEQNAVLVNTALNSWDAARGDTLVVLGGRGASLLEELNAPCVSFPGVTEGLDRAQVTRLKRYLVEEYLKGRFGRVLMVYAKFASIASQQVEEELLLPSRALFGAAIQREPCLIEPSVDGVVEGLVALWLEFTIAKMFVSSKLSELAARVMHLEGSDQELSRVTQQLGLQYAKHLRALADKSIREISTSRLKVAH